MNVLVFLVSQIKSLIGAGVANRVIALFDYDTAGTKELNKLKHVQLPLNYKIFHYPELPLACDYPTTGPTGINNDNINGLACSIELYLGSDALKNGDTYIPIQWKGYDSKLKKYHGEITKKCDIQKYYFQKLKVCEKDNQNLDNYDWSGIKLILNTIFNIQCILLIPPFHHFHQCTAFAVMAEDFVAILEERNDEEYLILYFLRLFVSLRVTTYKPLSSLLIITLSPISIRILNVSPVRAANCSL